MRRLPKKLAAPRGIVRGPGRGPRDRARPTELVRLEAPGDLAAYVEHLWIVRWQLGSGSIDAQTLPHPSIHWTVEGAESEIHGVMRGSYVRTLEGNGRVVAVKFRPGGFCAFHDAPMTTLTDRRLPATRVLGPRAGRIARTIAGTPDAEAAEHLCGVLRAHGPRPDPLATEAGEIVAGIASDHTLTSVDAVCKRFALHPLALQRLFRAKIGVTPKWVIQRYRMHEAVERLAASAEKCEALSLAALAADLGFTDQAHFCRVFKTFIGEPPGAYLRKLASRRAG